MQQDSLRCRIPWVGRGTDGAYAKGLKSIVDHCGDRLPRISAMTRAGMRGNELVHSRAFLSLIAGGRGLHALDLFASVVAVCSMKNQRRGV